MVLGTLPSFEALLDTFTRIARNRPEYPIIILIDELPYLAQADPAVPSAGRTTTSPGLSTTLFSRSGFSKPLVRRAKNPEERLLLFSPEALY